MVDFFVSKSSNAKGIPPNSIKDHKTKNPSHESGWDFDIRIMNYLDSSSIWITYSMVDKASIISA